jgi:hypothetical protein
MRKIENKRILEKIRNAVSQLTADGIPLSVYKILNSISMDSHKGEFLIRKYLQGLHSNAASTDSLKVAV